MTPEQIDILLKVLGALSNIIGTVLLAYATKVESQYGDDLAGVEKRAAKVGINPWQHVSTVRWRHNGGIALIVLGTLILLR